MQNSKILQIIHEEIKKWNLFYRVSKGHLHSQKVAQNSYYTKKFECNNFFQDFKYSNDKKSLYSKNLKLKI